MTMMTMFESPDRQHQPPVLVVDDDFSVRLLVAAALAQAGFTVVEADNGQQALAMFNQRSPSMILLDVMMPEMDGFTMCAELRKLADGKHVPVLMMTGLDDVDSVNHAYAAGATDFITKPINYTLLVHRVRYMLRAYQAMERLTDSERRLANAQRIANLGSWEWNRKFSTVSCSSQTLRILGLQDDPSPSHFRSIPWVHGSDKDRVRIWFRNAIATGDASSIIYRIARQGGIERHVRMQGEAVFNGKGQVCSLQGTLQDITEIRLAEERIQKLAYYDNLTGLPNRGFFMTQVKLVLEHAKRHHHQAAMLFLDLDDFKRVNDNLGHGIGDKLLKMVAERISHSLYSSDTVCQSSNDKHNSNLARLGGDEFTVLLAEIAHSQDAAIVADKILDIVSQPFKLGGHEVFVTPSVGIAVFPQDGTLTETLLKHADMAMYSAKHAGKSTYRFFDESMNEDASRRLIMERHLRKALDLGELSLHYQPQRDAENGRICGIEALLRWNNTELGSVSPANFIPLAEETGLIKPIGEWALHTACSQAKAWYNAGLGFERIAVNISVRQFSHADFYQLITRVLNDTGLQPSMLELEVTESLLMSDAASAIQILKQLKSHGILVAIDDFGTGYSNLAYLKRFPIDRIKIDSMFVRDIVTDPNDIAIATAVIKMAHGMGLEVTAEGVETKAQLKMLKKLRCDEIQGFYLGHPMPAEELSVFVEKQAIRKPEFHDQTNLHPAVLLVDDDHNTLAGLARLVGQAGYSALTASSAGDGLKLLAKNNVSVVISDYFMPGMDGVEFLKRVSKIHPGTVRIMLSGQSDRQTVINAINNGAISRFLDKPIKLNVLRSTLRSVISGKKHDIDERQLPR
ncbi:MAG: EAL domain-containing protein [Gammaproteobacteria bacterium]|nr:EAL domain-containing protein [Gammaproteobacteria bacterium]